MAYRYVTGSDLPDMLLVGVDKAISVQQSAVTGYVQRLRRGRPEASPTEIVALLERRYLAAVTGSGAAAGGAAAAPGVGTALAVALSAGESAVFLETTALFTLAVADVHNVRVDEVERRRMLLLAMVLGDGGSMLVEKLACRSGQYWGRMLTDVIPMSSITAITRELRHWLRTKYSRQRGLLVLGRIAPFAIGAGIGAIGNYAFGRMVVSASRRAFGPAPPAFAEMDGVVPLLRPRAGAGAPPAPPPLAPPPESPGSVTAVRSTNGRSPGGRTAANPPQVIEGEAQGTEPPQDEPPQGQRAEPPVKPEPPSRAATTEPSQQDVAQPAAEPRDTDTAQSDSLAESPPPGEGELIAATAADPQVTAKRPRDDTPQVVTEPPVTGKYRALFDHLVSREPGELELTFAELDAVLTGGLPDSASKYPTWWRNSSTTRQAKAWLAAGYEVAEVDLTARTVRFSIRADDR